MKLYILENNEESKFLERLVVFLDVKCAFEVIKTEKSFQKSDLFNKCVLRKLPVLELDKGVYVNGFHAIIKAIIEKTENPNLLGKSHSDRATIDQFVHLMVLFDAELAKVQSVENNEIKPEVKTQHTESLRVIDEHLKFETFLAGTYITYSDFSLLSCLIKGKVVFGHKFGSELVQIERLYKYFADTGF